jgi:hypothetical protein
MGIRRKGHVPLIFFTRKHYIGLNLLHIIRSGVASSSDKRTTILSYVFHFSRTVFYQLQSAFS